MKNTEKQLQTSLVAQIISNELEFHTEGRSSLNLALFLANKDEITAAVKAGLSSKIIWKTLHESKKFIGGYETFRRYVRRYITHQTPEPDTQRDQKKILQSNTVETNQPGNFSYSPEADPKKLF